MEYCKTAETLYIKMENSFIGVSNDFTMLLLYDFDGNEIGQISQSN
jgi:hypothetical protein